jgi:microcystin-dependent protein
MADPFVAEIRVFAFNFAPKGWALCDGAVLPVSQNTALFSLLGTIYGGDGRSTFALPNIQGRVVMHPGQSPGTSFRVLGETGGEESVLLTTQQIPSHFHTMSASQGDGTERQPEEQKFATGVGISMFQKAGDVVSQSPNALGLTGGSLPHNNLQPFVVLNFCIATQGVYPSRG